MLRRAHASLWNGRRSHRFGEENDRRLRVGECRHNRHQLGWLRIDDEGVRSSAARRSRMGRARCGFLGQVQRHLRDLCELEPQAPRHPLKLRVAYHDACHLQHAQGVREQPRACWPEFPDWRLRRFPKLRSAAARPASTICCSPRQPTNSATARWTICCPQSASRALGQSRLPAATDERPSPARVEDYASLSYGGAAGCFDPRHLHRGSAVRDSNHFIRTIWQCERIVGRFSRAHS